MLPVMDDIEIRRLLEDLGTERANHLNAGHEILTRIGDAAAAAVDLGINKNEIARRAQISPTTLYALLGARGKS